MLSCCDGMRELLDTPDPHCDPQCGHASAVSEEGEGGTLLSSKSRFERGATRGGVCVLVTNAASACDVSRSSLDVLRSSRMPSHTAASSASLSASACLTVTVYMCVCMYVCMCTHKRARARAHTHKHTHTNTHTHVCIKNKKNTCEQRLFVSERASDCREFARGLFFFPFEYKLQRRGVCSLFLRRSAQQHFVRYVYTYVQVFVGELCAQSVHVALQALHLRVVSPASVPYIVVYIKWHVQ